jgi:dCTP deaminase
MTILNDKQILDLCRKRGEHNGMIDDYAETQVRDDGGPIISYGLSSYGYDARLADEFFAVVEHSTNSVIDPKRSAPSFAADPTRRPDGSYLVPANEMVLARTVEYFRVPDDVFVICLGKSTYARCGLIVNVTPLEPGWCGHVTLELSNTTSHPIVVYPNEGICQFVFYRGERPAVTYGDRNGGTGGKYQKQSGVTLSKV